MKEFPFSIALPEEGFAICADKIATITAYLDFRCSYTRRCAIGPVVSNIAMATSLAVNDFCNLLPPLQMSPRLWLLAYPAVLRS
jgi:hypothetical protein